MCFFPFSLGPDPKKAFRINKTLRILTDTDIDQDLNLSAKAYYQCSGSGLTLDSNGLADPDPDRP
jgi:hypothetical protein